MNTPKQAALQYHTWGANVTAIERNTKGPAHRWEQWHQERQDRHTVERLPWQGYICKKPSKRHKAGDRVEVDGVGIINGPGG